MRNSEEYEEHHTPGATLIPPYEPRNRLHEVDRSRKYIVYCHGGACSAVATLIMARTRSTWCRW